MAAFSSDSPAGALRDVFAQARREQRAAFIGYLPSGYPTKHDSDKLMACLASYADVIEVGIPFSDPMMDGPVIQEAGMAALKAGFRVKDSLSSVRRITDAGGRSVVMSYWNPILQYGPEKYAEELAESGGLGTIIPDLLPEESARWAEACHKHGLAPIYLVAPSTSPERMALTVGAGDGFVYAASHMGVTGAQQSVSSGARDLVNRVREHTDLPVAVGLGVSNGQQAAEIAQYADGVIVGSALICAAKDGLRSLEALAKELSEGVRRD